ncbi:Vanillate O-demethylase oxygenase subunit [Pseudomonas chlororaphis]|uniref:Vanillate O-demethylase oxygenase subunit n=2 Tax=Pseudomonas chlororaphis TaxID=587753 RepID=A0A3G7TMN7_9PSED|nr:Vanillate O-demethylase oxygenase subunit [Pseudomonas chlororaphis]
MNFIRNAWYAACQSQQVRSGEMFHRVLLEEPVVFYRKQDGSLVALRDRCPHRFVPLHLGKLQGDEIECGYHGLRFDCTGSCVSNPHGDNKTQESARVQSYSAHDRYGLVWIWMGDAPADSTRIPHYGLHDADSNYQVVSGYLHVGANYLLMADNLLDLSHLMYLHDGLLGDRDQAGAKQVVQEDEQGRLVCRRWMPNSKVPAVFDLLYRRDQKLVDMWTEIRWMAPSYFWFDGGVHEPQRGEREDHGWWYGQHLLTPETKSTTHYHFAAALPPGTQLDENDKATFAEMRRFAFAEQDKVMLEAQQAALGDSDFWAMKPALFSVDAAPVRMRRAVERLVNAEIAEGGVQP